MILVLEDEPAVLSLVARNLEHQGYKVLQAGNGEDALELARGRDDIDLLLSDVVLPGLTGPLVARKLRASNPGLRVVFMSGFTDDALLRHRVDASDEPLLEKPFTREALLRRVEEVLADEV